MSLRHFEMVARSPVGRPLLLIWLVPHILISSSADHSSSLLVTPENGPEFIWDEAGYVFYCPCHGRFGNQADQFIGSMAFAKQLNRTLVLPPWRTYAGTQKMTTFDDIFEVEPLQGFHKVILAADFVTHLAPDYWPLEKRSAFCYQIEGSKPCTTDSVFFEEFWKFVGIPVFTNTQIIKGLRFDAGGAEEWKTRFPPAQYPVIALRGPPAPFPVPLAQWALQKYLIWSKKIVLEGRKQISLLFGGNEPFLGIHLRNGDDWTKACTLLEEDKHGLRNLMASSQCIGEYPLKPVSKEMCFPDIKTVMDTVTVLLQERRLKHVYIATDSHSYIKEFTRIMPEISFVHLNPLLPQIDLFMLGEAELFLGNCVSSFSSFVRRQREVSGKETLYFGLLLHEHLEL